MTILASTRSTVFWGISAPYKNRATAGSLIVEYLVVAGGGGGGYDNGGGGGAGGFRTATGLAVSPGSAITVTVGNFGSGSSTYSATADSGGNSVFGDITAVGGGGGGSQNRGSGGNGANGGSGGGRGLFATGSAATGVSGQGNNGGLSNNSDYGGGGGGGAGAVGANGPGSSLGGNGGVGREWPTGSGTYYAGGGGAGGNGGATNSLGGNGGGGAGSRLGSITPTVGTPNTGGGGGGGGGSNMAGPGAAGGSGVVILKYSEIFTITIGSGLTGSTTSPSGGYKITTITAGTGTVSWSGGGGAVTIPDPALWYKNSSIASLSNGSNISSWANSGTYGVQYNLTSGSGLGAAVPTKQVDSGTAAAYFDGSKFLRFANQSNITFFPANEFKRWTIFVVYRDGNGAGNFGFLGRYGADGVNGSIGMWPNGQGNFNQVHTNDGFPVNFAMPVDEVKLQRGLRWGTPTSNDGTITYWDGTSGTSSTSWSVYSSDLQVGGIGTARTTYNNGYLYELVLYERALSDAEVTTVRTYLNSIVGGSTPAPTVVLVNGSAVSSGTYILNNSNSANSITVTGSAQAVTFSLWGAAGGNGAYPSSGSSGAGGFSKGTVTLQPGTTYYLYVGQGGFGPSSYSYGAGGSGGWPNGGYGTVGDASGGGGGGMTMLSTTTFNTGMSDASILLIAGGGGGSTGYAGAAGAGGGSTGQSAAGGSTGGTQSSGGTYNGTRLTGGPATGSQTGGGDDGGGGGGGYYGGGGGTSDARPGAGGAGYANTSLVSSITLTTGSGTTAPNPDSTLNASLYANGRVDVTGSPANGRPGVAYITFGTPTPTLPAGTLIYTAGQSFDVSSSSATFYADSSVTSIKIEISGGGGGGGGGWNAVGAPGGAGGIAAGIYNLSASRIFTYYVGSGGSRGAGYASPGHGGGSSAIVIYDTFTTIAAAGGGGGGGDGWNGTAGTGGAGGSATSQTGPYIGNGSNGATTQSAGGGGGTSSAGTNSANSLANAVGRTGGKGGTLGGSGGGGASGYGTGGSFSTDYYWAGGGGGGGYTGGAGGWGSSAGDGGGGGSSYLATGISSTTASFSGSPGGNGAASGNGQYNAGTNGGQGRIKVTFI